MVYVVGQEDDFIFILLWNYLIYNFGNILNYVKVMIKYIFVISKKYVIFSILFKILSNFDVKELCKGNRKLYKFIIICFKVDNF